MLRISAKFLLAVILLAGSAKAIEFDCDFQTFTLWPLGPRYTCNATVTFSGSTSLENVTGLHQTGRTNADVQHLQLHNQNLSFIPKGIVDFFNNLDVLVIDVSSLTSISAEDLRPFPNLLMLSLWRNELTSLDGDLFKYTPHLEVIEFGSNQIQHIGHDLVTNLNNLTFFFIQFNVCINRWAVTRDDVLLLASELSIFCPPLDVTTTTTTTTTVTTTTETPIDECPCDDEIEELREENRALGVQIDSLQEKNVEQSKEIELLNDVIHQQNRKIEKQSDEINHLIQEIAVFKDRMLEVEKKMLELASLPHSK